MPADSPTIAGARPSFPSTRLVGGEPSRVVPYNAAAEFVDANVAGGSGAKVAFTDRKGTITYSELQSATCRFGRGLYGLGIKPERRIVLLLPDSIEFPIAFW